MLTLRTALAEVVVVAALRRAAETANVERVAGLDPAQEVFRPARPFLAR